MNVSVAVILFISLIAIIGVANVGVKQFTKDVKSDKTKNTISITQHTINPTVTKTEISPTPKIKLSPTKAMQKNLFNESNNLDFKYPNSVILENSNELVLESDDNPDTITNWYKEKIKNSGMNSKAFVQTKTNDNVLNKLAGASGTREVNVEIIKKSGEIKTTIRIKDTMPIHNT